MKAERQGFVLPPLAKAYKAGQPANKGGFPQFFLLNDCQ